MTQRSKTQRSKSPSPGDARNNSKANQEIGVPARTFKVVNKSVEKVDGLSLTTGRAVFADDFAPKDCLVAKIVLSPHAHANIRSIDTRAALALPGVVAVLTHEDVPRIPHTKAGQGYPEPSPYDTYVLDNKVRFVGDRVAVVAARSRAIAEQAVRLIKVDYEVLEAVLDYEKAMDDGAPVIHDEPDSSRIADVQKNIAAEVGFKLGESLFDDSDHVVEGTWRTQYAQHCPLEPHIVVGWLDPHGRLVLHTSTQVPFHARRITAQALGLRVRDIRVIKPRIGGGFGAKQEVLIEDLVAALVLKTRLPVKLEYTRWEEFISSRTRHPMTVSLSVGANADGSVTDADLRVISNTGANGSHSLTVICCAGGKVFPLYHFKKMNFEAKAVYSNLPVSGAYRGYGATQSAFAMECAMDQLAEKLKMDPIEFRKKNHIRQGETSPVFRLLGEGREGIPQTISSCGLEMCLELGAKEIGWKSKRAQSRKNRKSKDVVKRGVGMAALMQGSSIPGVDMASTHMKMNEDGSFNLSTGAADLGTGADTVMAQIAAEELCTSTDQILVYSGDTDLTPFDVGAYASSTTFLSGQAARKAAAECAVQIKRVAGAILDVDPEDLQLKDGCVLAPNGRKTTFSDVSRYSLYMVDQFQIQSCASHISETSPPPFSAHFVEVEVDRETGLVRVIKYVAAVDCGTAINPNLAEGQTEGAVLNGISYALTEELLFDDKGRPLNANWSTYKLFNSVDCPEIKTILVPTYEPSGPFGAKSVSEISINGALPAIANAIYDAVGVRLYTAPFTPDRVLAALESCP